MSRRGHDLPLTVMLPMKTDQPRAIRLKDYRPPEFLIDSVLLNVVLEPTRTEVASRLKVRRNPAADTKPAPLVLDGDHLELVSVTIDGKPLKPGAYIRTDSDLTIIDVPAEPFVLAIQTIVNPEANTALQGLYRTRRVYCTQCEAQGFRRITYFLDRPDVLSVYTCRIEAPVADAPVLLSNGNLVERGQLMGGKRHYAIWKDPFPKPCYLFALVGGNLVSVASTFTTAEQRSVDLRIYVEPGKESRAHWAMDSLKRAMAWDERRFGCIYDLDVFNIVAVSDFNLGAMENKSLNVFNDRLILASPDTATDAQFEAIESVVAHEYFHNWTGNRITCRDWFQLCLKEGLTVYRDQEFSAEERSAAVQRISDVRDLRTAQFPEDGGPLAHPVRPESYIEINNFYTATVYNKGAEVVRILATILGPAGFKAGMDLYLKRHDGQAATVEEFIRCFEDATGRDLSQFMLWYVQAGTPTVSIVVEWESATRTAVLRIEQALAPSPGQPRKKPMHIPIRIGLVGSDGRDMTLSAQPAGRLDGDVLHLTKRAETFRFTGLGQRPIVSALRGFSAPVRLEQKQSEADLAFLMANDRDLFNRWQAANSYALMLLVAATRKGEVDAARADAFATSLDATLADAALEPAYKAELLTLPSEEDIAAEIARNVDPAAIAVARKAFQKRVASRLGDRLDRIYNETQTRGPLSPDAVSAGKRALRNRALGLLVQRGGRGDIARLQSHYDRATNMTDSAFALSLLASRSGDVRQAALDDFFNRWSRDHVVIDTWFAVQARAEGAATLSRVRTLTRHPLYAPTAPNKVRSLVSSFAYGNPSAFNRSDGGGYKFVADQVMSLDAINPQLAARLVGAFRSWRRLEPGRRKLARGELKRIVSAKRLSRDVFEMVDRMLSAPPEASE